MIICRSSLWYHLGVTVNFDMPPKSEIVAEFVDIQVPHLARYGYCNVSSPNPATIPKACYQAAYGPCIQNYAMDFCCVGSGG